MTYVGGGGGAREGTFEPLFAVPVDLKAHAMAGGMASSGNEPTGEHG